MLPPPAPLLSAAQLARLRRFGVASSVDVHCHCLPGVDDGPSDLAASLRLCRLLVQDGVTTAIATPHALGRYAGRNTAADVRAAVQRLNGHLGEHGVPLTVVPGADVRVDDGLCDALDRDEVLALPDCGGYVLLELPHASLVPPERLLGQLRDRGLAGVLSHPERHRILSAQPDLLDPWLRGGALLQITAGSLLGDFGDRASAAAWGLLRRGKVALVASDAHDASARPPRLAEAIDAIAARFGEEFAGDVCVRNPLELLLARRGPGSPGATAGSAAAPLAGGSR